MQLHRFLFTAALTCSSRVIQIRDRLLGRVPRSRPECTGISVAQHIIPSGKNQLDAVFVEPAVAPPQAAVLICHGIGEIVSQWFPIQRIFAENEHRLARLRLLRLRPQHWLRRLDPMRAGRCLCLRTSPAPRARCSRFLSSDSRSELGSPPPSSIGWPLIASSFALASLLFATLRAPHGSPNSSPLWYRPSGQQQTLCATAPCRFWSCRAIKTGSFPCKWDTNCSLVAAAGPSFWFCPPVPTTHPFTTRGQSTGAPSSTGSSAKMR